MNEQFHKIVDGLSLSKQVAELSLNLWLTLQNELYDEGQTSAYMCCCVYITVINESNSFSDASAFLISDMLKRAKVDVPTFFKCMRHVREVHTVDEVVSQKFIKLEKRYCISVVIFLKLKQYIKMLFEEDEFLVKSDQEISGLLPDSHKHKTRLMWILYLLATDNLNSSCELIMAFNLLVCSMHYVMLTMPSFQLKWPFADIKETDTTGLFQHLCQSTNNCFDEAFPVQMGEFAQFIQSPDISTCAMNVKSLENLYRNSDERFFNIDEIEFLSGDSCIAPSLKDTETGGSDDSGTMVAVHDTPIKAAFNSVQSLRNLLQEQIDSPSPELCAYFKICSNNPEMKIQERIEMYRDKFALALINVFGKRHRFTAPHRFKMAVSFYYRLLYSLLSNEERRLGEKDFSTLLNKEEFHLSLLACCTEIVMTTYNISWNTSRQVMDSGESEIAFPWILGVFDLKAVYFYKVLESVIKAEPSLPKEIIRHLQGVENCILESIAWQKDSPLFDWLNDVELPVVSNVLNVTPTKENGSGSNVANDSTSFIEDNVSSASLTSPLATSHQSQISSPRKTPSLSLFFDKVCRLGYYRLQAICGLLKISNEIQRKIWTCFEHCILKEPYLLKDRHLDQIMMCSIYALCKIAGDEIKFKAIVNVYKSLPHAVMQTYKQVLINDGVYDTVVSFYNQIFSQVMKNFILQFSKSRSSPTLSPYPKTLNSPIGSSYSLPGRPNFRVSPLKSPFKVPKSPSMMTPKSRLIYCFGDIRGREGSAEKFRKINETLAEGRAAPGSCSSASRRRRLEFDVSATELEEPPKPPVITRMPATPEKKTS